MSNFEQMVKMAAESAVAKFLHDGTNWLKSDYGNRFTVPSDWFAECWKLVDLKKVQSDVAKLIENELAERIVNSIATELATDIKQILSVKERREAIRSIARDHMEAIMKAGS